ncbi:MAG: hypothetical protein U9R21_03775, partial [Candidatus Thermoplasmatota archaeon]|nr:hypothetical protein [Candidatus Thermoplasmatota archaeon]
TDLNVGIYFLEELPFFIFASSSLLKYFLWQLGHVIGDSAVLLVHLCPQKGQFSFFIAILPLGDITIYLKTYPLEFLIFHSKNLHLEKTKPNRHKF